MCTQLGGELSTRTPLLTNPGGPDGMIVIYEALNGTVGRGQRMVEGGLEEVTRHGEESGLGLV